MVGLVYPQRDMRWLHGFLNDMEQVLTHLAQVYFIAQGCAERFQYLRRIILSAVEAAVDDALNTVAQGLEEGGNDKG